MNRTGFVPRMMATAGEPGVATSIVRHLGRKTGGGYKTPLQAPTTADGFVIPLPYGITADWLENVRAVGSAVIIHGGDSYPVDQPESISLQDAMRSGSPPTHAGRSSLATTP